MTWRDSVVLVALSGLVFGGAPLITRAAESRFAVTHNRSQYVHWIDLYDNDEQKIDPDDPAAKPYSPVYTCGRCHDYRTISHGFHFNANTAADGGRPGEPWIWTDTRTGTQLPLSYRQWPGTHDPRDLGISRWDFVLKFGHHFPGGGPGEATTSEILRSTADKTGEEKVPEGDEVPVPKNESSESDSGNGPENGPENRAGSPPVESPRWQWSGELHVDCMICHRAGRRYSPEIGWKQIEKQNFAWAPTAALGMADVTGAISDWPDDYQPPETDTEKSAQPETDDGEAVSPPSAKPGPGLPTTVYRPVPRNAENKVFFDIRRRPSNSACYYCHTTRAADASAGPDWTHDDDVHLRAGMLCVDCHRNGVDHMMVRGYEREPRGVDPSDIERSKEAPGENSTGQNSTGQNSKGGETPSRSPAEKPHAAESPEAGSSAEESSRMTIATLSCRGCHLGVRTDDGWVGGGRLGAPKPEHRGLPPLHLDRLSCTACHSGPRPAAEPLVIQSAKAHQLGLPSHDYGPDLDPLVAAPVLMQDHGVLYPHRMIWPAFWGLMSNNTITPLNPDQVHETLRRKLRVRRNSTFTETFSKVTLSKEERTELVGADRADVAEAELRSDEVEKLTLRRKQKATKEFREKIVTVLPELRAFAGPSGGQPVYVSGGRVYRLGQGDKLQVITHPGAAPYAWKLAHDVRPKRWSTGAIGCFECHAPGTPIFEGRVTARGPAPDADPPSQTMAELAGYDRQQLDVWNRSFQGRTAFKYFGFVSAGLVGLILLVFLLLGINGIFRLFH